LTLTSQITADGSFTFFSEEFGELFHSHSGARQEAEAKFVAPCQLSERASYSQSLCLLDICYGLGYNSAAALAAIWEANPHCQVELVALELDLAVPQQAIAQGLLRGWPPPVGELLAKLAATCQVESPQLTAKLWIGDARQVLQTLRSSGLQADAIFLDPFSPPKCPQLWTVEFLAVAAQCLNPQGRLATYSAAAAVRTALQLAGLQVAPTPSVGRRSPGTVASFDGQDLPTLSEQERQHLQTRAAIPYRDRHLGEAAECILQQRRLEQQGSSLEPTSQWKKRWKIWEEAKNLNLSM
jgi:tRNA U34 5-methylaminomethyl-2-thiouridine-forming methyltransferase MnmC